MNKPSELAQSILEELIQLRIIPENCNSYGSSDPGSARENVAGIIDAVLNRDDETRRENDRLRHALAYLADCHAANAEYDANLASCSKSRRSRFRSICEKALSYLRGGLVDRGTNNPETVATRLERAIAALKEKDAE